MALKFQELPPAARGTRSDVAFKDEVRELVSNPGKWAILAVVKEKHTAKTSASARAHSMASNIKTGKYKAFGNQIDTGDGVFEAAVRGHEVWVRYVPRASEG